MKYFLSESVAYYTLLVRATSDMAAFLIKKKKKNIRVISKTYKLKHLTPFNDLTVVFF